MIAVDTNLLVYAHRAGAPEHARACRIIEQAAGTGAWGLSLPCIGELFSVVTHPSCPPRPSTPAQVLDYVEGLIEGGATIWSPGPGFGTRLLRLAAERKVAGARIFDLQIALMAFEGGATELWSHDRNFQSVPGLPTRDPLQA